MSLNKIISSIIIFLSVSINAQTDTIRVYYDKTNYEKTATDTVEVLYNFTSNVDRKAIEQNFENEYTKLFLSRFYQYEDLRIISVPNFSLKEDSKTICGSELIPTIDFSNDYNKQTYLIYTDSLFSIPINYSTKYFKDKKLIKLTAQHRFLDFVWSKPKKEFYEIPSDIKNHNFWDSNERFLTFREILFGSGYEMNDYIVNNLQNFYFYLEGVGLIMEKKGKLYLLTYDKNMKFQIYSLNSLILQKNDNQLEFQTHNIGNEICDKRNYYLMVHEN
jgi:hypothetical protein